MRRPERHARRDVRRLVRYLTGESPAAERAELKARLAVDEKLARLLDELRRIWDAAEETSEEVDVEAVRAHFYRRVEQEREGKIKRLPSAMAVATGNARAPRARGASGVRRTSAWRAFLRVFAVVAAVGVAGATAWLLRPAEAPPEPASPEVFVTKPGQLASVRLADGTDVRLSVNSRLTVPPTLAQGRREVELEGEAFFEVASDSARPFRVQAEGIDALALGTTFNVRAYPGEAAVQVVVAEGRVALRASRTAAADTLVLESRQLARLAGGRLDVVRSGVEVERLTAWREGRLVFEGAPFAEVARELERWYDVEVEREGNPSKPGLLTAAFTDEPLGEILKVVALALRLDYRREGRRVLFYPASSSGASPPPPGGRPPP